MYYPYLRGKQYELILLREMAESLKDRNVLPIVEPVRKDFAALTKTLKSLNENEIDCCVIVNPKVGQLAKDPDFVIQNFESLGLIDYSNVIFGYLLQPGSSISALIELIHKYKTKRFNIIHQGFTEGKELADAIASVPTICAHIFMDGLGGKRYQRIFKKEGVKRILIRDGFKQQPKNADYPKIEHFSELHLTYEDEGMDGFGDFLIVGNDYSETGGPAYAIALHLTYIDPDEDEDMFIYHFISDQTNSPTDPGGKFLEALRKLVKTINRTESKVYNSSACDEFRVLNETKHYPGLGHVKKLSMRHHIELIIDFLEREW